MGHRSNSFDVNDKFFKSQVMNKSLGGGASGRLFLKLKKIKATHMEPIHFLVEMKILEFLRYKQV